MKVDLFFTTKDTKDITKDHKGKLISYVYRENIQDGIGLFI